MDTRCLFNIAIISTIVACIGLANCGRRGSLEPPSGRGSLEDAVIEHNNSNNMQEADKPQRRFILDGLI